MTKKVLLSMLSVLLSVTMYTPVNAEGQAPATEDPGTNVQETEAPEEAAEKEEEAPAEPGEPAEDGNKEEPETPETIEEPGAVEEAPQEQEEPAAEENKEGTEERAEEPAEEQEITTITPDPVTFDGVTVTVSYPSDTFGDQEVTLIVGEPGEKEKEALEALGQNFKAVDISFADAEGNEVQPVEGKNVSVVLKAEGMEASEDYKVVHVDAEGVVTELTAETSTSNEVTEHVKTGERTKTIEVPAETETVPVEDYEEETYTDYETVEKTIEVPAEIGYRTVRKSREVEKVTISSGINRVLRVLGKRPTPAEKKVIEYYYEEEPYEITPAHTETITETVPVTKTRNVLVGTHEETKVIKEAYSYEETEDVFEDITTNDVETSFSAASFSVYAVIPGSKDDEARATVEFYGIKKELVKTYYVKNSDQMPPANADDRNPEVQYIDDIVTDPGIGGVLPSGQIFVGWYVGETDNYTTETTPKDINDIRQYLVNLDITEGMTVKVYAMIFKVFTVSYYVDEGTISMGSDEIKVRTGDESAPYTVSKNYTPTDKTEHFEGWLADNDGAISDAKYEGEDVTEPYKMGTTMTISGNINFTVYAPKGKWLVFDENGKGATYNAPQFVKDGEKTKEPTLAMNRLGYEFVGWYTEKYNDDQEADTSKKFNFDTILEKDTTIYAKWSAVASAPYTVIFWKQNVAGTAYDFESSQTVTGTVGTAITVTPSGSAVRVTGANPYNVDKGFSFGHADTGKTVAAEGNTVVNVYIDRNEYTLTFIDNSAAGITFVYGNRTYNATVSANAITDSGDIRIIEGEGVKKTISGYEMSAVSYYLFIKLNGEWHQITSNEGYVWNASRISSASTGTVKTITARYEENIRAEFPITGSNGKVYEGALWSSVGSEIFDDDAYVGFINDMQPESTTFRLAYNPSGSYYTYYVKYYVEALPGETGTVTLDGIEFIEYYTAIFHSERTLDSTESEEFTDLTGYAKYKSNPAYVNGKAKFDSNNTISLYYTRKKFPISYMDGRYFDGDGNPFKKEDYAPKGHLKTVENIVFGSDVSSYNKDGSNYYEPKSVYPGFVFEGWYIDDACTTPYTFTNMPEGGVVVYAKWRQIEYRVFLHPNAKLPGGQNDSTLTWGSEKQAMNFRVPYLKRVSVPTGTRSDYEFIGWFTDKAGNFPFNEDTKLTESIVTAEYVKADPANYTDPMDIWGDITGTGSNSDITGWDHDNNPDTPGIDRYWITNKLDLYGKWSAKLTGAEGIGIIYNANGGDDAPLDPKKYKDNVKAVAGAASTAPKDQRFLYWVVQTWDKASGEYVDAEGVAPVYPGDGFTVLKQYARETDLAPGVATDKVYKAYTMQLRAEYGPAEAHKNTYMRWYMNDQNPSAKLHEDKDLYINEAVDIYTLKDEIPERTGYKFLGWAREAEYEQGKDGKPTGDPKTYYDVDANDLYLKWDAENKKYQAKNAEGTWVNVTQVAADEKMPYQAWYAVWEPDHFFIFHSATGDLEAVEYTDKIDLTSKVTKGYLYGGYYKAYGEFTVTDEDKANAEKSGTVKVTEDTYDPSTKAEQVGLWKKDDAYQSFGTELAPKVQTVYYLKEVPNTYLRPTHITTYQRYDKYLRDFIMLSTTDDENYRETGFIVGNKPPVKANMLEKLTITFGPNYDKTVTDGVIEVDVKKATADHNKGGYVAAYMIFHLADETNKDYKGIIGNTQCKSYWITPDGIKVTGGTIRRETVRDKNGNKIIEVFTGEGEEDPKEITYRDFVTTIHAAKQQQ